MVDQNLWNLDFVGFRWISRVEHGGSDPECAHFEIVRFQSKYNEIQRNPTKSNEIQRNPTKSNEIQRNPTKSMLQQNPGLVWLRVALIWISLDFVGFGPQEK